MENNKKTGDIIMLFGGLGILATVYVSKQLLNRFRLSSQETKQLVAENNTAKPLLASKVGGVSIVMASVGSFYPPLTLLSLIVVSYNSLPALEKAVSLLHSDKKIGNDGYTAFVSLLLLSLNSAVVAGIQNTLYHISNYLIAQSQEESIQLISNAYYQAPETVWVIIDSTEQKIPLADVKTNDAVIITTGETIPLDGVIQTGIALIDQQALTGEANPIEKMQGDSVMAATIVLSGRIVIHALHSGETTRIDKLNELLLQTTDFKTELQLKGEAWADRVALPVILTSVALAPFIGGSPALALLFSVPTNTVRAMLSVQTATHMQQITHQGVLIKDGRVLEELLNVDVILFDKTGTLTQTYPEVVAIICCAERNEATLLALAAAAEQRQQHPIAKAIINKAKEQSVTLPEVTQSHYDLGMGVTVTISNQEVKVGSQRFIQQNLEDDRLPVILQSAMQAGKGHTFILISVDGKLQGALELHPLLRAEVPQLIHNLRQREFKQLALVSGDQHTVTERLATQLSLDTAYADILPEGKAALIKQLQNQGHRVCFVGDGLNDAIAMKQANVSVCLSSASTLSREIAQIILLDDNLAPLDTLFEQVIQLNKSLKKGLNIWVAFGVANAIAVPLLGFGPMQSSVLYGGAFITGLKLSKKTPKNHIGSPKISRNNVIEQCKTT
jgi:Cu2+-exporting ATPase